MPELARYHRAAAFSLAAFIYLADQISKWVIIVPLNLREKGAIVLLPIFKFQWVENYGVSMGLFTADGNLGRWILVAVTAAIATGVAVWIWREQLRPDALALGAVLGGAIGNITDRVRFGYVVDFLDLHFGEWHPFLVFNIADAAITIGVLLLVLRALLVREKKSDPSENMNA